MKKSINLRYLLLVLINSYLVAQDLQGSAFYIAKTNVNTDFTKNIPIERRQYVINRIKSNSKKNYQLDFNNTSSLFYEEQRLDVSGSSGGRFNWMSHMNPIQGILHRDYSSKIFSYFFYFKELFKI